MSLRTAATEPRVNSNYMAGLEDVEKNMRCGISVDYERIRSFIDSYSKDDDGILNEIYNDAIAREIPVIRRDTKDLLKVLIYTVKPHHILEIGTAVGYSALVMAGCISGRFHIDTYEIDDSRISEARENIDKLNMGDSISVHKGDAAELLCDVSDVNYDFVFIDAAKAQYKFYMEEALRLSHPGTVIVSDNILSGGDVLESHYLVEKRDRTIHDRMREYLLYIKNDKRLETAILSVGDGVAVSVVL